MTNNMSVIRHTHTHTHVSPRFEVLAVTLCLLKMSFTEIASHRDGSARASDCRDTTIYGKYQRARILNISVKDKP